MLAGLCDTEVYIAICMRRIVVVLCYCPHSTLCNSLQPCPTLSNPVTGKAHLHIERDSAYLLPERAPPKVFSPFPVVCWLDEPWWRLRPILLESEVVRVRPSILLSPTG
jgi:hypothetical protein